MQTGNPAQPWPQPTGAIFTGRLFALLLALLLVLAGPAAAQTATAPYFPVTIGSSWTYQDNGVDGHVSTITGTQAINGVTTLLLTDQTDGSTQNFSNDANGIRQHRAFTPSVTVSGCGTVPETDVYSPPVQLAPVTWSVGQSVASSGTLNATLGNCGTFGFSYSATSALEAEELITVPAGRFLASRVRMSMFYSSALGSASLQHTYWLAPQVGTVKQVNVDPDGTRTLLLTATNIARTAADPFSFVAMVGTNLGGTAYSTPATITGMTVPSPITVSGGQYSIDFGPWTATPGTISNGQTLLLSMTIASTPFTQTTVSANIGGTVGTFSATTGADTIMPTLPGNFTATAVSPTRVSLAWQAASDNVAVTAYKILRNAAVIAVVGPVTGYSDSGLAPSTAYSYQVQACDAAGNCSTAGPIVATTLAPSVPGAPTNVSATAGNGMAWVNYTAPANDGGTAITAYTVTASPGGQSATGTGLLNITGLSNGVSYTFTVTATNGLGTGTASSPSNAVTPSNTPGITPALLNGFNLLGNTFGTPLNVVQLFGSADNPVPGLSAFIASVWKWDAANQRWAFHSPQLGTIANAAFAASRGYAVLSNIAPGEGYWVSALGPLSLPLQSGTPFNWTSTDFGALASGFHLIAHAGLIAPRQFNAGISSAPPAPGAVPTANFTSLWAWDAQRATWFFYAPQLEASGGLAAVKSYADSHYLLHFEDQGRTLGPGTGFWVQRP